MTAVVMVVVARKMIEGSGWVSRTRKVGGIGRTNQSTMKKRNKKKKKEEEENEAKVKRNQEQQQQHRHLLE